MSIWWPSGVEEIRARRWDKVGPLVVSPSVAIRSARAGFRKAPTAEPRARAARPTGDKGVMSGVVMVIVDEMGFNSGHPVCFIVFRSCSNDRAQI